MARGKGAAQELEPISEADQEQIERDPPKEAPKQEQQEAQEPQQQAQQKPEFKEPPEGYVPHGAFHEERERRKRIEAEAADLRKRSETMEKRFEQFVQQFQPKPPAIDQDPVGYFDHRTKELEQKVAEADKFRQSYEQERQYTEHQQRFMQAYGTAAQQYAAQEPNFMPAYQYLAKGRIEELMEAGYQYAEAYQVALQDEQRIVAKAFQDGVNPAERVFKLAVKRGYKPAQAEDPGEKITRIDKGQRANPDFSPSSPGKPKISLSQIADMDDADFARLDWEKVVGGLAK